MLIVTAVCFVGIVMLGTQVSRVLSTVGASVGPAAGDAYPGTNAGNPGTNEGGQDSNPNGGGNAHRPPPALLLRMRGDHDESVLRLGVHHRDGSGVSAAGWVGEQHDAAAQQAVDR